MIQRIADALLVRVYHPVSALVALDQQGEVLEVQLFDTMAGAVNTDIIPHGRELLLISHHPEGCEEAYPQDWMNLARISRACTGASLRFYMVSEYFSCRQVILAAHEMDAR